MELQGIIIAIGDAQSGVSKKGNQWVKKQFVIETVGRYPQQVAFSVFNKRIDNIPAVGTSVVVKFDASSREYNGKWYTELTAWDVALPNVTVQPNVEVQPVVSSTQQPTSQVELQPNNNIDELPF